MARPHDADARKRPFTQVRLYGELADMVEVRAEREGKSRSNLVDELIRLGWHNDTDRPTPIDPTFSFDRVSPTPPPPEVHEDPPRPPRARVFVPRRM
jgi:hypothetical protein